MAIIVLVDIRRVLDRGDGHTRVLEQPAPLGTGEANPLPFNISAQAHGPATEHFTTGRRGNAVQGPIDQGQQAALVVTYRKGKPHRGQPTFEFDLQTEIGTQGGIGTDNDFVADEHIHFTLTQGFQGTVKVGRNNDLTVRINTVQHVRIGIAIKQHDLLAGQARRRSQVVATANDYRSIGHVFG